MAALAKSKTSKINWNKTGEAEMTSSNVKKYLEQLKTAGRYDSEFIDALIASDVNDDDWFVTTTKLSEIINRRYVESKNNKA